MTTESPMRVEAMQVSITFKFCAAPAIGEKLAHQMLKLLRKENVSADATLAFEKLPASAAGGGSTAP